MIMIVKYIPLLMSSIYSVQVSASNDEAGFGTTATVNVTTGTVCVCVCEQLVDS